MTAVAKQSVSGAKPGLNTKNDITVMIVDDSVVVRGLVSSWIDQEPGLTTVAKCSNGLKAVESVATVKPNIVVLDIEMPVMDGIEALPKILKNAPGVTVIMASTLTQRNAEISLKALSLGATDYVAKPTSNSGITTSKSFRKDLIDKIFALGAKRTRSKPIAADKASKPQALGTSTSAKPIDEGVKEYSLRKFSTQQPKILAIGSSTGGPPALMKLIEELAPIIPKVPVLITQHMPATFTSIFAEHLARASGFPSQEGIDGEPITPGKIYVAPGGKHMIVERNGVMPFIRLIDGPEVNYCKPAVDPMFESICKIYGASTLAAVLTGMGFDGSAGAVKIADAGGSVIAQDEKTSVVWGMPGATAKAGACSAILALEDVAPKLKQLIQG